jgi:hypothetical protein
VNPTLSVYEPPISMGEMPDAFWMATTQLAPGVKGHTFVKGAVIFIPLIVAEREGSGDVGRFLDRLSARCIIMSVSSERLRGMLARRGWKMGLIQQIDYWMRPHLMDATLLARWKP